MLSMVGNNFVNLSQAYKVPIRECFTFLLYNREKSIAIHEKSRQDAKKHRR